MANYDGFKFPPHIRVFQGYDSLATDGSLLSLRKVSNNGNIGGELFGTYRHVVTKEEITFSESMLKERLSSGRYAGIKS